AGNIEDIIIAEKLNISRIELNQGLSIGGLTPSHALVKQALKISTKDIVVMIRPREGETILLMTVFFSTTLAPIAGKYGWHLGIIAGIFHFSVATQIGAVHGGMNLYNNGLAAGIVSSIYVPI
ncbi:copper homeostasis protein CutC, partial [Streptobacillus moniliformis]|uniref:copper homeostasis protein CutC n=1 Tax=Streptobacillus moniliformis TaxID=34105 RepID=UPI000A7395E8